MGILFSMYGSWFYKLPLLPLLLVLACTPDSEPVESSSSTTPTTPWGDDSLDTASAQGADTSEEDTGQPSEPDTGSPIDTGEPPEDEPCASDCDEDGWTLEAGDCEDEDATIHPGADEICDDGIDNDCSGTADLTPTEEDGVDLYTLYTWVSSDCSTSWGDSLGDRCTHSEEVRLDSSGTGAFELSMDCPLEDVPELGSLSIEGVVDTEGRITLSLAASALPISGSTQGEMCNGTAYQYGDPDLWDGSSSYAYEDSSGWSYSCYTDWYFTLGPSSSD